MTAHDASGGAHRGRIKDARGRAVTQLDPIALYVLRQHDVIDADTLRTIANEKGVRVAVVERVALISGLCGALLVIGIFTFESVTGGIRDATLAKSTGLLYLCSMPWIIWYVLKRRRFGNVAAAMLRHRRCPHCGYDLRMLPVDAEDGATVCPECGCAWILTRDVG
jgi:hypothetical protein